MDCLDGICFQGIHPSLFEVVVVSSQPAEVQASMAQNRPPFSFTVADSGVSMEEVARGKLVVQAPIERLYEPGALMQRIYETAQG